VIYTAVNYCIHRYVNDLEFFDFHCITRTVVFFQFTEHFCIYNASVIDGKIRSLLSSPCSSPSWVAKQLAASQETHILRDSQVPILSQLSPARTTHPTSWRSILILSLGVPNGLFRLGFLTNTLYMPLLSPYVLHDPPISFFSILSPTPYSVSSTDH
jgi:hypothetical protein